MIEAFEKLNHQEVEAMLRAPLLACVLIAGADGEIDRREISKAIDVARKRATKAKSNLTEYFEMMGQDFEDKLKVVIQSLPAEVSERNPLIVEELSRLNQILAKLDKPFAAELYKSMRDLALKIASSSGGVLGIKSVGNEEARYIDLPMIRNPSV